MRFPFVSREMHEQVCAVLKHCGDAEHENAQALRRQLTDLTAKYHQLRLSGAVEMPIQAPIPVMTPNAVTKAINDVAGSDRTLRALMHNQVARDKQTDPTLTDEQIALRIYAGMDVTDGGIPQ